MATAHGAFSGVFKQSPPENRTQCFRAFTPSSSSTCRPLRASRNPRTVTLTFSIRDRGLRQVLPWLDVPLILRTHKRPKALLVISRSGKGMLAASTRIHFRYDLLIRCLPVATLAEAIEGFWHGA